MYKAIVTGSTPFFENIESFVPGDIDLVVLEDKSKRFNYWRYSFNSGIDITEIKYRPKEELLEYYKKDTTPSSVLGMFLTPEFIDAFGLTIDDVKEVYKVLEGKLTPRQSYQRVIAEAYFENNGFTLTDEQRLKAYEIYKAERVDKTEGGDSLVEVN